VTVKCHFSFYDEVQMQVTKPVQNVPFLHGHGQKVVNVSGWSCRRWRSASDCPTRQSNAVSDCQRLAPSPNV